MHDGLCENGETVYMDIWHRSTNEYQSHEDSDVLFGTSSNL